MSFDSAYFFATVAFAVLGTFLLPGAGMRARLLLLISCAFYAAWEWRLLPVVLLISVVAWGGGLMLARARDPLARKHLLVWIIVLLALPLCVFKYTNFALANLGQLLEWVGHWHISPVSLILPVGISFFTFHAISYVVDVSEGRIPVEASLVRVSLYIAFFPHMIAGPIVRPHDFLPQVSGKWHVPQPAEVAAAMTRFLWGLAKKTFIADRLTVSLIDPIFANPEAASPGLLLCGVLAFGVMIYADFSGYSDMAISTAGLMGIKFRENFLAPYTATSIREFWRRWHVSLSSWIRDYIYIPLGGSRSQAVARRYGNLLLAMALCGLWHGASWAFVLWGVLHGAALVVERMIAPVLPENILVRLLGWVATTMVVFTGWALFRAADLSAFAIYVKALMTSQNVSPIHPMLMLFLAVSCAVVYLEQLVLRLMMAHPHGFVWLWRRTELQIIASVGLACFLLLLNYPEFGSRNFIYFQF